MVTRPSIALLELAMALEASRDGIQVARHDTHLLGLDSCKLLAGLQGEVIALMELGQHVRCTARMACGVCEQHTFIYRP